MDRIRLGFFGQELAEGFLRAKGYDILKTNFRSGRDEIDIIAVDDEELVGVEVKTRRSENFGTDEETINPRQMRRINRALGNFVRNVMRPKDTLKNASAEFIPPLAGLRRQRLDFVYISLNRDYSLQRIEHMKNFDYE